MEKSNQRTFDPESQENEKTHNCNIESVLGNVSIQATAWLYHRWFTCASQVMMIPGRGWLHLRKGGYISEGPHALQERFVYLKEGGYTQGG